MTFRIWTLMIDIAVASVYFTFWHLIPNSRFVASLSVLMVFLMFLPCRLAPPKQPGLGLKGLARWSDAYHMGVIVGFEVINVFCSGLTDLMATWPG